MTNHINFTQFWAAVRRKGTLALCLVLCILGLGLSASAQVPTIITFEAPGAGTGAGQGTIALGNDAQGAIMGSYIDASNVYHGFLRAPDGRFTTIDVPGAPDTVPNSINSAGVITGWYVDANNVAHGFLWTP